VCVCKRVWLSAYVIVSRQLFCFVFYFGTALHVVAQWFWKRKHCWFLQAVSLCYLFQLCGQWSILQICMQQIRSLHQGSQLPTGPEIHLLIFQSLKSLQLGLKCWKSHEILEYGPEKPSHWLIFLWCNLCKAEKLSIVFASMMDTGGGLA